MGLFLNNLTAESHNFQVSTKTLHKNKATNMHTDQLATLPSPGTVEIHAILGWTYYKSDHYFCEGEKKLLLHSSNPIVLIMMSQRLMHSLRRLKERIYLLSHCYPTLPRLWIHMLSGLRLNLIAMRSHMFLMLLAICFITPTSLITQTIYW